MKTHVSLLGIIIAIPLHVNAEDRSTCLQESYDSYSRKIYSQDSTCLVPLFEVNQFINQLTQITEKIEDEVFEESFWDKWAYSTGDDPLLTGYLSDSAVGFTVWQPEEFYDKKMEEFDSYGDWLESHGLQLSLAFGGEEKGKKTRFRIDYRWHERANDELFMQFEIPFQ